MSSAVARYRTATFLATCLEPRLALLPAAGAGQLWQLLDELFSRHGRLPSDEAEAATTSGLILALESSSWYTTGLRNSYFAESPKIGVTGGGLGDVILRLEESFGSRLGVSPDGSDYTRLLPEGREERVAFEDMLVESELDLTHDHLEFLRLAYFSTDSEWASRLDQVRDQLALIRANQRLVDAEPAVDHMAWALSGAHPSHFRGTPARWRAEWLMGRTKLPAIWQHRLERRRTDLRDLSAEIGTLADLLSERPNGVHEAKSAPPLASDPSQAPPDQAALSIAPSAALLKDIKARRGRVVLNHGTFGADSLPDIFDSRDLEYRPRLQALPSTLDTRPPDRFVMSQEKKSSTGYAVAALVNAVRASVGETVHASAEMLNSLARRYNGDDAEDRVGTSLRGALMGWYHHGILQASDWPDSDSSLEPDLDHDHDLTRLASKLPLGSFYRVDASRLEDLRSALVECSAVAVSASIHEGWVAPLLMTRTVKRRKERMSVIVRGASTKTIGDHTFCLVGYNEVGFLVQNSWGTEWGDNGFAILAYDDWLKSGYDAWVARPGVPSIMSNRVEPKVVASRTGALVETPALDIDQLANHVVNLGPRGSLARTGRFTSSDMQLSRILANMGAHHEQWPDAPRRILIYAPGTLRGTKSAHEIAQKQVNWWIANQVYPITFAWQAGRVATLEDQLFDLIAPRLPVGGWPSNQYEQADRMVEETVKASMRPQWHELKENADLANARLPSTWPSSRAESVPGGTLFVARLKEYISQQPASPIELHLVGHSSGSIFLTGLIERCVDAAIPIASLTYLSAAIRTDTWARRVLPHLRSGAVAKFTAFGMGPGRERDDNCGTGGLVVYNKSFLHLVSRALELPRHADDLEASIVGLGASAEAEVNGKTFLDAVREIGGDLVWSPSATPPQSRSDAASHEEFDEDSATMTSVLLRIHGQGTIIAGREYVPNQAAASRSRLSDVHPTALADLPPEIVVAEVHGETAVTSAVAWPHVADTRSSRNPERSNDELEGNPVLTELQLSGWRPD